MTLDVVEDAVRGW